MSKTSLIDLFLVVPPGLDASIFPWGVTSLSSYAEHFRVATARTWMLSEEPWLEDIAYRHAEPLQEALELLSRAARNVFVGHTASPHLFVGAVGALGARFVEIAKRRNLVAFPHRFRSLKRLSSQLDEMSATYLEQLRQGIRACISLSDGGINPVLTSAAPARVWGISVYDYTLFNSLLLAHEIRAMDPGATVVLGGDYFDYGSAMETLRGSSSCVDGIVVGYGEEVLRKILETRGAGRGIESIDSTGLVTRRSLLDREREKILQVADSALGAGRASRDERERAVSVPTSYRPDSAAKPIDYVQVQDDGTVRVLTQRGCSWGKCTFCSQIDRRLFFPLALEPVLEELERVLGDTPSTAMRHISLDADENDLNAVLPLLEVIRRAPGNYTVELWLMVRKFGAELPRFLVSRCRNLELTVILNIESLNADTLKRMKKGVTPLQILEAVKAVQDSGHKVRSNYFLNFPGEDVASVRAESDLLHQVRHLIDSDRIEISAFSYMANSRDEIHFGQDRLGLRTQRLREDVWNDEGFGVDLPFSIWSTDNGRRLRSWSADALVGLTYHKRMFSQRAELLGSALRFAAGPAGWSRVVASSVPRLLEKARARGWAIVHAAARWTARDSGYARRSHFFDTLGVSGSRPRLFIDKSTLESEAGVPVRLSPREEELLTHLYWRRQRSQLERRFEDWGPGHLDALLSRHQELGSIVAVGQWLLCVAHQPGYWHTEEARSEGPKARSDLKPRLLDLV